MKQLFFRAALLLLTVFTVLGSTSCANHGKTLLYLEKDGIEVSISVNAFQLLMARQKAKMGSVDDATFWDTFDSQVAPNKTRDEFYRDSILENSKIYLISLYLFDYYGLTLSASSEAKIEEIMQEFITTDGGGSKTKLNSVLADYGVNYDILRDVYVMMAKIEAVQTHLYGTNAELIGDTLKTEFMENNYVHFNQIYLPFSKFVYETDAKGNEIYYVPSEDDATVPSNKISYDKVNGKASDKTDKNGDIIYYLADGETVAYRKLDALRKKVTNEDGSYKMAALTQDEKDALLAKRDTLYTELVGATPENFVAEADRVRQSLDFGKDSNTDGYYIFRDEYTGSYKYLNDAIALCDTLKDGEIAKLNTEQGYFIIQKDKFTEKAYSLEDNKSGWFQNFNDLVVNHLFEGLCSQYLGDVVVDTAVYAEAPRMKDVKRSYFY